MKQFWKIFKFEFKSYLRNKVFVGITLFLVAGIAVAMFWPNLTALFKNEDKSDEGDLPVMLVYAEDATLAEAIQQYFALGFAEYQVEIAEGDLESVKTQVSSGDADCAFAMNGVLSYTYYVNNLSMYDFNTDTANALLQEVVRMQMMMESGLPQEQVGVIMSVQIEGDTEVLSRDQTENFLYTSIMIYALYMVVIVYGQMVSTNVATEKSSRAMELLITSAKPTSMMFGKVLASCAAGLMQLSLVFGSAILFYGINKDTIANPMIASAFNIPVELFAYMLVFFILGFLIYAFMFGAVGSTVSRLEDLNTAVMPISYLFMIGFLIVTPSVFSGNVDNTVMKICSYVPFTSPMAMFARLAMSTVPTYEIIVSILILVGSVLGVGILSARIYRVGVLLYGNTPKLGKLIKSVLFEK